jgi:protocatechuate 3,4-dioxygenase beta subunit
MSPKRFPSLALAASLLLGGCMMAEYDAALNGASDGVPDEYLRVDVHPSDRNPDLKPESHWVDGWWLDESLLEIAMSTPVHLQGAITASRSSGGAWGDEQVRTTAVGAEIAAWIEGSIMSASTTSDSSSGNYSLLLPPQRGWAVAVVPEDGSNLPFQVLTDQDIVRDRADWDVQLDNGAVVRGTITGAEGEPLEGVPVRAIHSDTGVVGPAVFSQADGGYTLHLEPARYTLELGGEGERQLPTTMAEIEAVEDEIARVDLEVGSLETVPTLGRVMDARTGRPVQGVSLRFWSRGLEDHPQASLELEASTDQAGAYRVELLPGQWRMELVAQADQQLTPTRDSFSVRADQERVELGAITMEPYRRVQAVVRGPSGEPASDVTVVVSEQAISDRTFTATTDAAGGFILDLPASELHVVLTPGDSNAAVTHLDVGADSFPQGLDLALGTLLTGLVVHDGTPVQAALVEVRDGQTDRLYATTITDLDGNFELRLASDAGTLAPNEGLDDDTGYWDTGYLD